MASPYFKGIKACQKGIPKHCNPYLGEPSIWFELKHILQITLSWEAWAYDKKEWDKGWDAEFKHSREQRAAAANWGEVVSNLTRGQGHE